MNSLYSCGAKEMATALPVVNGEGIGGYLKHLNHYTLWN